MLCAGVSEEEGSSVGGLACDSCLTDGGNEQVDNDVGVNVAFDSAVAILYYFFPYDTLADFGDEVAPFLGSEGGLAFLAIELYYGI
jgi:hypothetical protein